MNFKYDSSADALYLSLQKGKVERTEEISDVVTVDYSFDNRVLGIEILEGHLFLQQGEKSIPLEMIPA